MISDINQINMRSLNDFHAPQDTFRTPTDLPPFFNENLVDPNRVVKVFQDDPQAHIRVFYYQYLKLCFEINHANSEALVQKIEELINNPTFQFIFYQEDDPEIFNDTQAKRLISEFFGVLSSGETTVLDAINSYPIMDTIMVHFFRTLMILMDKAESLDNFIPRDELLSFLCSFFGIEVELHDACIKYVDTDVFVYDHRENLVYMAYIIYTEEPTESQPTYENEVHKYQQKEEHTFAPISTVSNAAPPGQASGRAPSSSVGGGKESYIASEFYDYTNDNLAGGLANKGTTLKGSDHFINPVASSEVQEAKVTVEEPKIMASNFGQEKSYQYQDDFLSKINSTSIPSPQVDIASTFTNSKPKYETPAPKPSPTLTPTLLNNQNYQPPAKPISTTIQNSFQPNIPTKDYSNLAQVNQYTAQSNQYTTQSNQYTAQVNQYTTQSNQYTSQANQYTTQSNQYAPSINQYPPPAYLPQTAKPTQLTIVSPPKPTSWDSGPAKDLFYVPKEAPLYNPKIETQGYGSGSKVTGVVANSTVGAAGGKKKVFGLNVSEEFTNSLTIKSMAEPFKTNVINIKTRARDFRSSLVKYVK